MLLGISSRLSRIECPSGLGPKAMGQEIPWDIEKKGYATRFVGPIGVTKCKMDLRISHLKKIKSIECCYLSNLRY